MPDIEFTQYLRPNGRRETTYIDRPVHVAAKAAEIAAAGYFLECEALSTGHASFTIADRKHEVDVDIEICPNGPEVHAAIDRLILRFDAEKARKVIQAAA